MCENLPTAIFSGGYSRKYWRRRKNRICGRECNFYWFDLCQQAQKQKNYTYQADKATSIRQRRTRALRSWIWRIKKLSLSMQVFKTPNVLRKIFLSGKFPAVPCTRPKTKDGFFRKFDYVYMNFLTVIFVRKTKFWNIIQPLVKVIASTRAIRKFVPPVPAFPNILWVKIRRKLLFVIFGRNILMKPIIYVILPKFAKRNHWKSFCRR